MQGLDGRVALVTGGAGGLGSSVCEVLAERGATIVVADLDGERAERVAARCSTASPRSLSVELDVADAHAVSTTVERLVGELGGLDVLVTAAGISAASSMSANDADAESQPAIGGDIAALTDAAWSQMLRVHLDGTFHCARAVVPVMRRAGKGSIVCFSSIAALAGHGSIGYSAAKAGILGLVRSLARAVAPDNIRVNAVCPGAIDAGMTHNYPRSVTEQYLAQIPLGRLGTAREVATTVAHLASDDAAYTTGQWLSPNGGSVIA
jgi:NAD(P)-dependent dehydrogenase (short-subunit alcohol dehydrogenase family)